MKLSSQHRKFCACIIISLLLLVDVLLELGVFRIRLTGKTNVSALHNLLSFHSALERCRNLLGFVLKRTRGRSPMRRLPLNELHVNANNTETIIIGRTVQNAEMNSTIYFKLQKTLYTKTTIDFFTSIQKSLKRSIVIFWT